MIRVFIVDDHPLVVEGISSILQQVPDIEVTGYAMNAASCLGYFVKNTVDLVLLDINLPDQSGIEVAKTLLKRRPEIKIVALTNFEQLTYLHSMKEAGAKGYLLKNSSMAEIEKAIGEVMAGREFWIGHSSIKETLKEHNQMLLSRREIEVLRLIAQGLTNQEIADKLFVSTSTIDSHRKNLISKLQVKNTAALVRTALENKLI